MNGLKRRVAAGILCLALALGLALPARLACCAGLGSSRGSAAGDCCRRAETDAASRQCCQGGPRLDRTPAAAAIHAPPAWLAGPLSEPEPGLARRDPALLRGSRRGPPGGRELCLLHAVLLC